MAGSSAKIYNNIFENKRQNSDIIYANNSQAEIVNNTFASGAHGIWSSKNSTLDIINNIITGMWSVGVNSSSTGMSTVSYNNLWNNRIDSRGAAGDETNISVDPMFVNISQSDYHLSKESPCIDAGNPAAVYEDLDGTRNDIGAFGGPLADTTDFIDRQISLSLPISNAQTTDTVRVPLVATDISGISDINMHVAFDEAQLTILEIKNSNITSSFSLSTEKLNSKLINLSLSSTMPIKEKGGDIAEFVLAFNNHADTTTVLKFKDIVCKDQVGNVYKAMQVSNNIIITSIKSNNENN
ncbi:MAG: hypothetical protein GWN62_30440, partial [Aliifodinibius sp.]|nr:hypothetical protein [Fodinibius sp.]